MDAVGGRGARLGGPDLSAMEVGTCLAAGETGAAERCTVIGGLARDAPVPGLELRSAMRRGSRRGQAGVTPEASAASRARAVISPAMRSAFWLTRTTS